MFNRHFIIMIAAGTILLVVGLMTFWAPTTAFAQCGGPNSPVSSCTSCHAQADPVADKGEWHIIHAHKDICINCHGGNATTMDKDLAHASMTAHPLEDIYTDCHGCHPDYDTRAERFAQTLSVTPGSCATPTTIPVSNIPGQSPSGVNMVMPSNTVTTPAPQHPTVFMIISSGMLALALIIFVLSWRMNHPLGR